MVTAWLWAYSDRLSARAGDTVAFHVSGTGERCDVEVARLGASREVVWRRAGFAFGRHAVPDGAHINGCGWPPAFSLEVPAEWRSGYYDILLTAADGAQCRHMLCVRAAVPTAAMVLVLATNTYHAYNSWGGANTYAWVGGTDAVAVPDDPARHVVAPRLSTQRPFSRGLMKPLAERHRLVTERRRGFRERPTRSEVLNEMRLGGLSWDCPAGFQDKWEHAFVAWAEPAGYAFDYLTDADLETDPDALAPYRVVAVVGHSEYWSHGQRLQVERFVDAGGRFAVFSGNTCYWQCRWEDEGRTFVAHKGRAEDEDPLAADPQRRHLMSGLWSSPWVGRPEAALTGLSFLFGGYHRMANCVARGVGGYTVWRDDHWALAGADLYWGDVFGDDCRLVGYENDGCVFTTGADGLPVPVPRLGVPADLQIIATAPCTLAEPDSPWPRMVPPEAWSTLTRAYAGYDSPANYRRMMRGHAVMAAFRRGEGEVFNGGTTEWAYGLAAANPFVDRITRNVLDRFLGRQA
jgi:hypothetical protein